MFTALENLEDLIMYCCWQKPGCTYDMLDARTTELST